MMNVASDVCDSVVEGNSAPEFMIQMITQSVAASPWPTTPQHNCEDSSTISCTGGIFITSAAAQPEPASIKRSHSRNRVTWAQQFNVVEEDPRVVLERLEPIPVIRNEANEKICALPIDGRKKSSASSWFSFFSLSRRASGNDQSVFKPKSILKQVDDGSSVSSNEITTSASPLQKPKRVGGRLRFDNEVRVCETFHKEDYCRESVEYVAKQLTPAVAAAIKRELNEIKQEMEDRSVSESTESLKKNFSSTRKRSEQGTERVVAHLTLLQSAQIFIAGVRASPVLMIIDLTTENVEIEEVVVVEEITEVKDIANNLNNDSVPEQKPTIEEEPILYKSYYQRAFLGILESVLDVYSPILAAEEAALFTKILHKMEFYPQRLLVRLFLRKSGWLREAKLEYEDIVDVPGCVSKLQEDELIERDAFVLNDYVDLLTIPELKTLANRLGRSLSNSANRDTIVDAILTVPAKSQRRICFSTSRQMSLTSSAPISAMQDTLNQAKRLTGAIIQLRPEVRRALDLAISLYFLVASDRSAVQESLSTAILNEINRRKYPRYCIKRSGPIFADRREFEEYQRALDEEKTLAEVEVIDESLITEMVEKFKEALEASVLSNRSYFLKRYTAGWIYSRILGSLATALEAAKEHTRAAHLLQQLLAQTQFCLGRRGKWWERLVLDTSKHLKAPQIALRLCQQALNDPLVRTAARTSLQRRFKKLSKNEDDVADELPEELPAEMQPEIITIHGRIQQGNSAGRKVKLHLHDDDLELGSVESFVLTEFGKQGWQGIHCESSFFTTVFGLMFWDILFGVEEQPNISESQTKFDEVAKYLQNFVVEDVFQTAFQNAPLDLQTDAFYPARQSSIEARVRLIKTEFSAAILLLRRHHMYNYQQSCIGVDWDTFGGEEGIQLLVQVCELIGPEALAIILRQFAEDYRHHRSGLPDLLLWRSGPAAEGDLITDQDCRVLFAEVKSPNDRISDAQRYWFSVLKSAGMRVVLVQIKEKGK